MIEPILKDPHLFTPLRIVKTVMFIPSTLRTQTIPKVCPLWFLGSPNYIADTSSDNSFSHILLSVKFRKVAFHENMLEPKFLLKESIVVFGEINDIVPLKWRPLIVDGALVQTLAHPRPVVLADDIDFSTNCQLFNSSSSIAGWLIGLFPLCPHRMMTFSYRMPIDFNDHDRWLTHLLKMANNALEAQEWLQWFF